MFINAPFWHQKGQTESENDYTKQLAIYNHPLIILNLINFAIGTVSSRGIDAVYFNHSLYYPQHCYPPNYADPKNSSKNCVNHWPYPIYASVL